MMNPPLVSIIIPCYQAEKYVREAIESVAAQTYDSLEVFAIDDGSTDETYSVLNDYPGLVTVLQHPGRINRGVSLSRKLGIDHAKGKYIAFLDADDSYETQKIEKQVNCLELNTHAVLCHTAINIIGEHLNDKDLCWFNFKEKSYEYDLNNESYYLKANRICNSSVMIRAEIMRKIPFAGNQLFQFEDWLAWNLASEYGQFIFLPSPYTNYRFHSQSATNSISNNKLKLLYSYFEFYLTLASRSESVETRTECINHFLGKIEDAYCEYGRLSSSSGDQRLRSEFRQALASCSRKNKNRISSFLFKAISALNR